jgi:hypothetical protein
MRVVSSSWIQGRNPRGHTGGSDGELAEACHTPRFFAVHEVLRVEAAHLAVNFDGVVGVIEEGDPVNAGAAIDAALPERLHVVTQRG